MSKKKKIKKKRPSKVVPVTLKPTRTNSNLNSLILFDKKVKLFLGLVIVLYMIMSLSKIHTSSVAIWDQMFGISEPKSLLAGEPRPVRQDEWMLSTPSVVGQYYSRSQTKNRTLGDRITNLSLSDLTVLLKPNLWPYSIFDIERAFAFSWNFKIFFFIISSFLLFMLLTGSNFWLSLLGTVFIFTSGAMQWWSYSLGSFMLWLNGIVIALCYILYSKNSKAILFSGVILLICSYNVIIQMYPAWQVPLVYLYMTIFIGFLMKKSDFNAIKEKIRLRAIVGSFFAIVLLFSIYHFYGLIKETAELMMNTEYPGKRFTNGGDLVSGKLFSEFFGLFLKDSHFPRIWLNICEASSFIMFFPIIFYTIAYNYFNSKKTDWLQLALAVYIIIMLIWILIGFPSFLSKISLLSMSPVYRTLPVLGVANCILLICYLGNKESKETTKVSWLEISILVAAVFIFIGMVGRNINIATTNFFTSTELKIVAILMTSVYLLIRYKNIKYTQPALAIILLGMNFSNIKIHPLTSGLSAILENPLVKATEEIKRNDPNARWAVFGSQRMTNLLKVNRINVFNGVKHVPSLKEMAVLDPTGKDMFIYNRYAHINMFSYIDNNDGIQFKLNENAVVNDNYSIFLDPCSPRLKQLGLKYFLFTDIPKPQEIRCMNLVKELYGMSIYKRNEQ